MEAAINGAIASTTASVTSVFTSNIGSITSIWGALVAFGLIIALVATLIHKPAGKRR